MFRPIFAAGRVLDCPGLLENLLDKMAILQQIFGTPPLPAHDVGDGETVIGRQDDCDIVLDSPAVSRQHARITNENGRYFLEDLNSRNGTLLNGQTVAQRTLLKEGDQIEVSTLPFTFLSQNTLSELSGSWGVKPDVISISEAGSDIDNSIRRRSVHPGDRISNDQLGSDSIRGAQVVARVQVADGGGGWPVTQAPVEKLNQVLRMLHSLRRCIRQEDVIARSLQCLFSVFPGVERIAIVLRDNVRTGIQVAAAVAREKTEEIEVCLPVVRTAMQKTEALLYVDYLRGPDADAGDESVMRSILVTPLVDISGESFGAIQMDTHERQQSPGKEDLEKLVVISQAVAFALESALEIEAATHEAIVRQSTKEAIHLRERMSPATGPLLPGYLLEHYLMATPDIAADLVDYTRLSDGRVAAMLIDVPGRGSDAASLMAVISRLLSAAVSETGAPAEAIRRASEEVRQRVSDAPLVTSVAVAILDPKRSTVTIAVAGHCPLFTVLNGNVVSQPTAEGGGCFGSENLDFTETTIPLLEDDVVLIFADGITKLTSPEGDVFDQRSLLNEISIAARGERHVFGSTLSGAIQRFRGQAILPDDVAIVMIRRTADAETVDRPPIDSETFRL